jgi:hypothetical protein
VPEPYPSAGEDAYLIDGWDSRASQPGLSPRAMRAVRAVAEGLFATEEGPPPEERLVYLSRDLSDFMGNVTLRARLLFRACLAIVYWVAPLLVGALPPLGRLPWRRRVEALERMEKTPLAMPLLGAKALMSIVYYEHPDAARDIGWDQQPKLAEAAQDEGLVQLARERSSE